jgi:hypothetical protein
MGIRQPCATQSRGLRTSLTLLEERSDIALVIVDAETFVDDALEIDAPPSHDAVDLPVRARFDDGGQFVSLAQRQAWSKPAVSPADYEARVFLDEVFRDQRLASSSTSWLRASALATLGSKSSPIQSPNSA